MTGVYCLYILTIGLKKYIYIYIYINMFYIINNKHVNIYFLMYINMMGSVPSKTVVIKGSPQDRRSPSL